MSRLLALTWWRDTTALGIVAVEEIEHPVLHEQRREHDLLGLLAHHLEELLARREAEIDGDLAESAPFVNDAFDRLDLLLARTPSR